MGGMSAQGKDTEFARWLAGWMAQVRKTGDVLTNIPADDTNNAPENDTGISGHHEKSEGRAVRDVIAISHLKRELDFLDSGGYHIGTGWVPLRYFEDSPICRRIDGKSCDSCPLLRFAPSESLQERAPCRYIALNKTGETLNSLYVTGTNQEIVSTVRSWLVLLLRNSSTALSERSKQAA